MSGRECDGGGGDDVVVDGTNLLIRGLISHICKVNLDFGMSSLQLTSPIANHRH